MPESSIRVIERAVTILDCFVEARGPLGISEISRSTGLSKSTVHHFVISLVETGLLAADPATRRYRLGPKLAQLGHAFVESTDLPELVQPALAELRDLTEETATLHVKIGDERVTLAQAVSRQSIRRVPELGLSRPLWLGAVGMVLMAGLPDSEVEALLRRSRPRPITKKTLADPNGILEQVQKARDEGYSTLSEQSEDGVGVIALPIHDHLGQVPAAIVVSGPIGRWNTTTMRPHMERMLAIVARVSRELGRPPANAKPRLRRPA